MRSAYLWLARIIALLVVVQAMSIAWAFFGLRQYVEAGNDITKSGMESHTLDFPGVVGFPIHEIAGEMVIPFVALLLLIVSFFAKVRGGIGMAGGILVLVAAQIAVTKVGNADLGLWHGLGAFLIFGAAMAGAMAAKKDPTVSSAA